MNESLDADLATLKRLASRAQSTALSMQWAAATHERAIRTSAVLRTLPRIVPKHPLVRVKADGAWVVSLAADVTCVVLTVTTRTADRTPHGLGQPLPVQVIRPALVELDLLERLQERGMITLRVESP
jgi:Tfp pilus assembly protein PilN